MNIDQQAIVSAIKELLRLVIVAAIGAAVAWVTDLQSGFDPASLEALVIGLIIKFADRYAYKSKGVNALKF